MRLIDTDNISFYCNYEGDCTGDIDDCKKCENYICNFRDIQEQPTAYDVDKIVEELEKAKHEIASEDYCRSINDKEKCDGRNCFECCAEYLIKIVKQGVISDDVCEWKRDDMCDTVYKVCGGCFTSEYQKDFKFCPYCGKKIKVVE